MEDSCPPTPLHVLSGRNSKSPNNLTVSSPESDGMKSPNEALSPDSRCVICLGKLQNKSFTDSCFHQFCFQCLLQWSKVKPECPLCKQPFKSIIHNVRSNFDYDQYHIERREPAYFVSEILHSYNFDLAPFDRRFRYRSTMTRDYFRELAATFLTRSRSPLPVTDLVAPLYHIPPSNNLMRNRTSAPRQRGVTEFRRNIYEQDLWVQDLVDVTGRYRECTPQFYRENPAQIHRIIPWLNREVNALLINGNESQAAYVLDRIVSSLSQYGIRSQEFRDLVRPYFGTRTDHFIHEFHTFARSVYDISGFDLHAVYVSNPNYSTEVQEISSTTNDDDDEVEVIGTRPIVRRKKTVRRAAQSPVPGPSGLNSRIERTVELCDSDTDDVKVIDYVKPDPEVITLSSGDEQGRPCSDCDKSLENRESVKPRTKSRKNYRLSSSSECFSTEEDSDYDVKRKRRKSSHEKRRKKKTKRVKEEKRKSKVKSCVVVPARNDPEEGPSRYPTEEYSYEDSSLPSYWSLALPKRLLRKTQMRHRKRIVLSSSESDDEPCDKPLKKVFVSDTSIIDADSPQMERPERSSPVKVNSSDEDNLKLSTFRFST